MDRFLELFAGLPGALAAQPLPVWASAAAAIPAAAYLILRQYNR